MKKTAIFCAALLLLLQLCAAASANSWGLTGELLAAMQKTRRWDEYTRVGNQAGNYAVLGTQYHNALFCLDGEGALRSYTLAVYQPGDKAATPRLETEEDGRYFILRYGESEGYRFEDFGGDLTLISARIGDFRLYAEYESRDGDALDLAYYAEDAQGRARASGRFSLESFNIRLFPRSVAEVRAKWLMLAKLESGERCLGSANGEPYSERDWGEPVSAGKSGTAPVYSAPFGKAAWRAAKGKAAVGLNGDIWLLNKYLNADGQCWACIRYFVSPRTQRIGYALCGDLGLEPLTEQDHDDPGYSFTRVDVEAIADTWLTDDPDVSQYRQAELPRGTLMTCLGLYNDDYAYVALEVDGNGHPADGGAILWGFVPIRDLKPMEKARRQDVMEQLAGAWYLFAGGSVADDYLRLDADGAFRAAAYSEDEDGLPGEVDESAFTRAGVWYVTDYSPFENLYWGEPSFELTLIYDDGPAIVKGLALGEDTFSLLFWEGSGGYCRVGVDPEGGPAPEDANG